MSTCARELLITFKMNSKWVKKENRRVTKDSLFSAYLEYSENFFENERNSVDGGWLKIKVGGTTEMSEKWGWMTTKYNIPTSNEVGNNLKLRRVPCIYIQTTFYQILVQSIRLKTSSRTSFARDRNHVDLFLPNTKIRYWQ